MRDRIVVGVQDKSTRTRLLREKNLTLEMAIGIVFQEIADEQIKLLAPSTTSTLSVDSAKSRKKKKKQQQKPQLYCSSGTESTDQQQRKAKSSHNKRSACRFCGQSHKRGECLAYGKKCTYCSGKKTMWRRCVTLRNGMRI